MIQHGHVTDEKSKVLKRSRNIDQSSIFTGWLFNKKIDNCHIILI